MTRQSLMYVVVYSIGNMLTELCGCFKQILGIWWVEWVGYKILVGTVSSESSEI